MERSIVRVSVKNYSWVLSYKLQFSYRPIIEGSCLDIRVYTREKVCPGLKDFLILTINYIKRLKPSARFVYDVIPMWKCFCPSFCIYKAHVLITFKIRVTLNGENHRYWFKSFWKVYYVVKHSKNLLVLFCSLHELQNMVKCIVVPQHWTYLVSSLISWYLRVSISKKNDSASDNWWILNIRKESFPL